MKILIADDDVVTRFKLARILKGLGHGVVVVKNSAELIAAWQRGRQRVVFSDIELPLKHGIEACERIRELDYTVDFILMSSSSKHLENAYSEGFKFCLLKPFDSDDVVSMLNTI